MEERGIQVEGTETGTEGKRDTESDTERLSNGKTENISGRDRDGDSGKETNISGRNRNRDRH